MLLRKYLDQEIGELMHHFAFSGDKYKKIQGRKRTAGLCSGLPIGLIEKGS